ncbi:MAG: hypothetical protein ACRDO8_14025, partial [Nocardioidaceae bacterium]
WPESAGPSWERTLTGLIDDLDAQQVHATNLAETAVALRFELPRATAPASRYARWRGADAPGRPRLRVRPVAMGARGRWVKSAIGWSDVAYADQYPRERYPQAHLDLLRELAVASRSGSRHAYSQDNNAERDLHSFGPSLWRLLRDARELGLPLVAEPPLTEIRVATGTASVRLDLARGHDGEVRVRPGADLDGAWTDAADLLLIGEPAHGVALWDSGDSDRQVVTLAPLEQRPSPAVQRMLTSREVVEVPAGGLDDLLGEYVPLVRRLVPVTSHDASVDLPEPVVPRLALTVSWVGDSGVDLAWHWRYRAGDPGVDSDGDGSVDSAGDGGGDRRYPLGDPTASRGVRDLAAEAAILDRLSLTEEQVVALCHESAGAPRLVDEQHLRAMETVRFAQTILPGLRAGGQVEIDVRGEQPDFREADGDPVVRFATVEAKGKDDGRTDWLELEVIVTIGEHQVALAPLLEALATGQDRILLHKGVYVSIDRPEFDGLARLLEDARALQEQPRGKVRLSREQLDLWS